MPKYIWESPDWPNFAWDSERIDQLCIQQSHESVLFNHRFHQLSTIEQNECWIDLLALEASSTSKIEGEMIHRETVKSFIRKEESTDNYLEKIAAFILHADRQRYPLTQDCLFVWQKQIVRDPRVERGKWRSKPVQILSGPIGRETMHYNAPPADLVPHEMAIFLEWFNKSSLLPPIKSGLAHLYFEMIHPFADGNGRVGRAISNIALGAQTALSAAILSRRESYYDILERSGKGGMEVTDWLIWFLNTLDKARSIGDTWMEFTRSRLRIESHYPKLNDQQIKVVTRMLKAGPEGFKGGITAPKYAKIAGCMTDVAQNELADLMKKTVLQPASKANGLSSRRYELNL